MKEKKKKSSKWKLQKERTASWKWLKVVYVEIDDAKERLNAIEEFLGGKDNIKTVNERRKDIKCE